MEKPMFSEPRSLVTNGIRVSVRTMYIPEQSNPESGRYMFAYQIRISNESSDKVKLLRRKWIITDGMGEQRIVEGEGVVGQKPVLSPGKEHQYLSGCDFKTPIGKMEGFYFFEKENGEGLKVKIPAFVMQCPAFLN